MRRLPLLAVLTVASVGCAQVMVIRAPSPLHCRHDVLDERMRRNEVVRCFGDPMTSEEHAAVSDRATAFSSLPQLDELPTIEVLTDTYRFSDGGGRNSIGAKTLRILLYSAGDFFTLFLSQVVWIPLEMTAFDAYVGHAQVDYVRGHDDRWRVYRWDEGNVRR